MDGNVLILFTFLKDILNGYNSWINVIIAILNSDVVKIYLQFILIEPLVIILSGTNVKEEIVMENWWRKQKRKWEMGETYEQERNKIKWHGCNGRWIRGAQFNLYFIKI